MVRTQIYLDEKTVEELKRITVLRKVKTAHIIRESIKEYLEKIAEERRKEKNPLYKLIGLCEEGKPDASLKHDEYLYQKEE
ncbi:MAG: CopG family transcriptional regulator [bacterium]